MSKAQHPGFDEFYEAYPRKTSRKAAIKIWDKIKPSETMLAMLCTDIQLPRAPQVRLSLGQQEVLFAVATTNYQRLAGHDSNWVAAAVGITAIQADETISTLREGGLLTWDGTRWQTHLGNMVLYHYDYAALGRAVGARLAAHKSDYIGGTILVADEAHQREAIRILRRAEREILELFTDAPPEGGIFLSTIAFTPMDAASLRTNEVHPIDDEE